MMKYAIHFPTVSAFMHALADSENLAVHLILALALQNGVKVT